MILAIDVDYRDDMAFVAGVEFDTWCVQTSKAIYHTVVDTVAPYVPGQFYKRELPCILCLLREHDLSPTCIVVDGFVVLGSKGTPGLGMHLYHALNEQIPVVGVAKKAFPGVSEDAKILRGTSKKPLFVSAAGLPLVDAKANILNMHGEFRLPTLLKQADSECRRGGVVI